MSGAEDTPPLVVRAVDEQGRPIDDAQAYLINIESSMPFNVRWAEARDGLITFDASRFGRFYELEDVEGAAQLVVRAPGRAWTMRKLELPVEGESVEVVVPRGRRIELQLTSDDGRAIPDDLLPQAFIVGQSIAAWLANVQTHSGDLADDDAMFSTTIVEPLGQGRFAMRVTDDCESLYVLVNHPGFLRAFQAGPFTHDQLATGRLNIQLPRPATLSIHVEPHPTAPHDYTGSGISINCGPDIPDGEWGFSIVRQFHAAPGFDLELPDFPRGRSASPPTPAIASRTPTGSARTIAVSSNGRNSKRVRRNRSSFNSRPLTSQSCENDCAVNID